MITPRDVHASWDDWQEEHQEVATPQEEDSVEVPESNPPMSMVITNETKYHTKHLASM